ncbi:ligand-gated channel protein [Desulfothermus naphthae]
MRRVVIILMFVLFTGSSHLVFSKSLDEKTFKMEEIVVTATKTPKKLENVPATVTIIGPEQIKAMPARTVGDLLADLPGVQAYEPQGVGCVTPQKVRMRGMAYWGHVLIMIDGQPMNNPFTQIPYLTLIPIKAIDHIEVIRGPFSSLYGSSAGGGIINIITKDGGKRSYVEGWGQKGNFDRSDYGTNMGVVYKNYSLGMFFDHKFVDNYYLHDDHGVDTRNRDYKHDRFHAKLTGSFGENTLFSLSGGTVDGTTGYGIGEYLRVDRKTNLKKHYVNLQLTSSLKNDLELSLRADWLRNKSKTYGETLVTAIPPIYRPSVIVTDSSRSRAVANLNYTFFPKHILTVGSEITYEEAEKYTRDMDTGKILEVQRRPGKKADEDDLSHAFYIQYDGLFWKDRFEVVCGLRYDHFERYGSEISPKGTLRWNYHKDGNLKFSVGKGFRAPSLNELYSPPWSIAPFIVYVGNSDLDAETLISYELSLEQYFLQKSVFFRISPYLTKGEDFIDHVRYPDPHNPRGQIMTLKNIDKVKIEGIDVELSYSPYSVLTLFANYNYSETRDDRTDKILDGYPRNQLSLGARIRYSLVYDLTLRTYYSARYIDSYTVTSWTRHPITKEVGDYWWHSASVGFDWKDMFDLKVSCFNLFNDRTPTDVNVTSAKYLYPAERNYLIELSFKYSF